ncbi:furostanol glycoside 26-O-beta-glucosidase-like [Dioscorea cayenensis subsp. rotundata]|uniref:Furostanol glycoside 26-O-beta-glucosidase-like n=1 Tax=Dioscorea cayennensis subsp. rotundata TaxID=55577 RepID=A0AB40C4R2_DIOCR|nr:furostanol glycoside 26-O-beta-glucosidase-like [Dioscorea cayenensis subsp. rotundata]
MASIFQPISMSPTTVSLFSSSTSLLATGKPALLSFSFNKHSSLPSSKNKHSRRTSGRGGNIVCLRGGNITVQTSAPQTTTDAAVAFGRQSFPPGFTFGAATSAYQIEGAWNEGGRGPSIWDTFTQQHPEKIADGSNGNIAADSYHRYKEDVKLLKNMNVDSYRFSISWSRILPKGSLKGGINQEGINYYNNLINELIKNGITPYVTLFHWDVPQALEDEYGGFLNKKIMFDFKDYCEICFKEFGDRVKHWITLNEPWSLSSMGYGLGRHAPGRCSQILGCSVGNSIIEPYIVTHNLLLAHGAAARLYKDKYQTTQGGQVGITLVCLWYAPYDQSHRHVEASTRALDFMLAWYLDPLLHGDYPFNMKAIVRDRLPTFSKEEADMIKGSYDFIGINYYTARYARGVPFSHDQPPFLHINESFAEHLEAKDGVPIGESNGSWIYVYPRGLRDLLLYIKRRYENPAIYITENGISNVDKSDIPKEEALADEMRKNYLAVHLAELCDAIREGANVKGYFAWSLIDNFEWEKGYTERFGLNYVDFNTLERTPKDSAKWYSKFLQPKPQN